MLRELARKDYANGRCSPETDRHKQHEAKIMERFVLRGRAIGAQEIGENLGVTGKVRKKIIPITEAPLQAKERDSEIKEVCIRVQHNCECRKKCCVHSLINRNHGTRGS
jgi:hypothetical protein